MTKTHRKATSSAEDAFNRHYAAIWGEERWNNSLLPALLQPTRYACVLNRYAALPGGFRLIQDPNVETRELNLPIKANGARLGDEGYPPNCYARYTKPAQDGEATTKSVPSDTPFPPPGQINSRLLSHWNLDGASVLAASLLDSQPGEHVLDLCAAPGGKSVVICQRLFPHYHLDPSPLKQKSLNILTLREGSLTSNEADAARHRRLGDNLKAYLPKAVIDTPGSRLLRVDGANPKNANQLCVSVQGKIRGFDKVLIDAPCSSERHIIHAQAKAQANGKDAPEMVNWRPGSSKRLQATQVDLLLNGLRAARIGGTIIYATCSIEPTENDAVIERVLSQIEKERKKGLQWNVKVGFGAGTGDQALEAQIEASWAERTDRGWIALPDHPCGEAWGPLFFACLTKSAD
ncbi:hypothetical protein DOTSEDRAFT_74994 [Dothistroma septosporum NZE10]|uniref:NOL1/NOP2/Sun domain family member 4 n=1 Tax=Dothistroma septosporum (strain NZE10 / CBS 128990) TaxID=675120 RepID=N1PDD6_DOTSN|nr:hypothetical protein DOTSEDRAFT_74994 [Dothistroma septosporum NZE10]